MTSEPHFLDIYDIKARLVPAMLCAMPILVTCHYVLEPHFSSLFAELGQIRILGYLTFDLAVAYLFMQLNNRLGGKVLQALLFRQEGMPTTRLLMPENPTLSVKAKKEIARKFKNDFGVELPIFSTNLSDNERQHRLTELVARVRNATRGNMLVKNHNIEYGFCRNLCGGAMGALLISAANVIAFWLVVQNEQALTVSAGTLVCYGILLLAAKPLITHFGNAYAKVLFEQYLSQKP